MPFTGESRSILAGASSESAWPWADMTTRTTIGRYGKREREREIEQEEEENKAEYEVRGRFCQDMPSGIKGVPERSR